MSNSTFEFDSEQLDSNEEPSKVLSLSEYCASIALTYLEALPEGILEGLVETLRKKDPYKSQNVSIYVLKLGC